MKFLEVTLDNGDLLFLPMDMIEGCKFEPDGSRAVISLKNRENNLILAVAKNAMALQDKLSRISF